VKHFRLLLLFFLSTSLPGFAQFGTNRLLTPPPIIKKTDSTGKVKKEFFTKRRVSLPKADTIKPIAKSSFYKDTLANDSFIKSLLQRHKTSYTLVSCPTQTVYSGEYRLVKHNLWEYYMMLFLGLFALLIRMFYPNALLQYVYVFFNPLKYREMAEYQKTELPGFFILLVLISCLLLAFPLNYILETSGIRISDYSWGNYMLLVVLLFIFQQVKFAFQAGISYLFNVPNLSKTIIFNATFLLFISALLALPTYFIIRLNFPLLNVSLLPRFALIWILSVLFIRMLQIMLRQQSISRNLLFYLILYVCTFEIVPLLFIYKLFTNTLT